VIRATVERSGVDPERIVDVYFGAANQSGEDNRDVARMAALLAGLPQSVPGATVNRLCASGLEAVNGAARTVKVGEGDFYLAGGVESMSRAPWVVEKPERGLPRGPQTMHDTTLGWRMINPRMAELGVSTESMGETGENVAERYGVSRSDQDAFALRSHQRAVAATEAGRLAEEIVPIEAPRGRETVLVETDEGPRPDASLEKLAKLRPVFREGGTVTAGNASTLNDGAACMLIASEKGAEELGAEPLARVVASGVAGVDPAFMGIGPVKAVPRALENAGIGIDQIDLVEAERGLRLPGPGQRPRARDRGGAAQRQRRRDRPRPPARLLRRPPHRDPGAGAEAPRRQVRGRHPLRRGGSRFVHCLRSGLNAQLGCCKFRCGGNYDC
jgi:acetyl-CoA acetyltransferase family protein